MSTGIFVLPFVMLLLIVPVIIGVYVYNDAKRRGMNAPLWTLLAVLAPSLIGFIIYVLVRGNYSDMRCPKCNTSVNDKYVVCPSCGGRLKRACPSCETPVEPSWKVCPYCASDLTYESYNNSVEPPVIQEDKSIWEILISIIVVPIVIVLLLTIWAKSSASVSRTRPLHSEDYIENDTAPAVKEWLLGCGDDMDTAYVLKKEKEDESAIYLIYVPCAKDVANISFASGLSPFGLNVELELEASGIEAGADKDKLDLVGIDKTDDLYYIETEEGDLHKLKVYYNGEKLDIEITETDAEVPIVHVH